MKRLVISFIVAMALVIIPVSVALAADDTATVTVTAVPSYVSITILPTSWTLNNVDGDGTGVLEIDTIYYSNTVGDTTIFSDPVTIAEAWHALTNDSTVDITLKADMANFAGGDAMTNAGDGFNAANVYAAWVCASGVNWSAETQIMKITGSTVFWTSSSPGDDIDVAFAVETQSGAWGSGDSMSSSITLTATSA